MNNILWISILFTFCLLTSDFLLFAQAPQAIPYQAIARNASGTAIASTAVKVRFSIRDSIATGPVRYQETHTPTTSVLGLFSVNVGAGTIVSGSFSGINWGKNAKFLQVELDPAGSNTYTNLGTTQMMSVPYALNAGNGLANGTANNQIMYWNGTAWTQLNPGSNGQILTICNGVLTWTNGGVCPANLPTISTTVVSSITTTTATCGGNITSDGGGSITARGVCWSTSQNPTVALSTKTIDGSGTGSFTSAISGLSPGTTYYLRAYATNSAGTAYGNQVSLTTSTASSNPVDVDGNIYTTVTIGSQVWMKENLLVSKYRNGNPIQTNLSDTQWQNTSSGAYAVYNNSSSNNLTYGKLYNWYAVTDPRGLCPSGWHVPSDDEWKTLESFLGISASELNLIGIRGSALNIGGKLKAVSALWTTPNSGADNSTSFSALPGGIRYYTGIYRYYSTDGSWWTSTASNSSFSLFRMLSYNNSGIARYNSLPYDGFSVRCLKD